MCLTIKSGPHKAQKDFYTLKMMTNIDKKSSCSPYMGTPYAYGKRYKSKLEIEWGDVEKAIHSILVDKAENSSWLKRTDLDGFVLCKVPKNSTYYIGEEGDVASTDIEIVEPVADFKKNADWAKGIETIQVGIRSKRKLAKLAADYVKSLELNITPS